MAAPLDLSVSGAVATITIRRPEKSNALAPEHFVALADLLDEAGAEAAIRAVVLTGEGDRAFCAGADLSAEVRFFERIGGSARTGLGDVMRAAHRLDKPLIGRINGHCYAGGMGLLAACDLAVAVDEARFALPEIRLGIFPHVVLAGLEGRVAPVHLAELALTGLPISAVRAAAIGLVGQAVPRAELDAAVARMAQAISGTPAAAIAAGRAALFSARQSDFGDRLARAEALTISSVDSFQMPT